jgi:succinate dehydrogenase flavin-adding protein (antitoxin of CptAB toxin-antitoxin module)
MVEEAEVVPLEQVVMEVLLKVVMVVQDIWFLQHLETQYQHYNQDQDLQTITLQVEEVVDLMELVTAHEAVEAAVLQHLLMLVLELEHIVPKEQMY